MIGARYIVERRDNTEKEITAATQLLCLVSVEISVTIASRVRKEVLPADRASVLLFLGQTVQHPQHFTKKEKNFTP